MENLANLNSKFKVTLAKYIGIDGDQLKQIKYRFKHKIPESDFNGISCTLDLLEKLEKHGVFQIGNYEYLMKIIDEFDQRLSSEGHIVNDILREIAEIMKETPRTSDDPMLTESHAKNVSISPQKTHQQETEQKYSSLELLHENKGLKRKLVLNNDENTPSKHKLTMIQSDETSSIPSEERSTCQKCKLTRTFHLYQLRNICEVCRSEW